MHPVPTSTLENPRHTNLLHLPDEILLRIIDFLIPPQTIFPESANHKPRHAYIGQACMRLFKLVRKRLLVLDFVYPRALNDVSRIPIQFSRSIEMYTRLASPYAEVLRLPTDFSPRDPALTSLGWCPHLRELCVTMNQHPLRIDMEQYFIGHNKLQVLTLHTPGADVISALAYACPKIRKLALVTLNCSRKMVNTLDNLLATMTSLESLTISLCPGRKKSHYPPRLQRHLTLEPKDPPYLLEQFMFTFADLLRKHSPKLSALRYLSLWSGSRAQSLHRVEDDIHTNPMSDEVQFFAFYIDMARELAFDHPPDLKLHKLRLRMFDRGEPTLDSFMRGLIDSSTEVTIHLYYITVCYPRIVDQSNPPLPVIKEMRMYVSHPVPTDLKSASQEIPKLPRRFTSLFDVAVFALESLVIEDVEMAHRLVAERNKITFAKFLKKNRLKSVQFHYNIYMKADVQILIQALRAVTAFAPWVRELVLPLEVVIRTELVTTEMLVSLGCANNLRVLRLFSRACDTESHPDFRPYEDLFSPIAGSIVDPYRGELLVARLPEFLAKIRHAFPNMTHLYMDPAYARDVFDENHYPWLEQEIKDYERKTGVDASSLRTELKTWVMTPETSDSDSD